MAPRGAGGGSPREGSKGAHPDRSERERSRPKALASTPGSGDPLDPAARQAAYLAPPAGVPPVATRGATEGATEGAAELRAHASLEDLLPALVRKVAWSGDGRRGTVRLELGTGPMAGAEVVVESDEGRVRVQLRAPAGVDGDAWRRRVTGRLVARGLDVDEVMAR